MGQTILSRFGAPRRMNDLTPKLPLSANLTLEVGKHSGTLAAWLNPLPDDFYALLENSPHLRQAIEIIHHAPHLAELLATTPSLTHRILTDDLATFDPPTVIAFLKSDASPTEVAEAMAHAWYGACAKWVAGSNEELGVMLSRVGDALVHHLAGRLCAGFDVVALGSYALESLAPYSDLDVILLVDDSLPQSETEEHAQQFLTLSSRIHALEAPVELDLRMRRENGTGLLVRTYVGFEHYELDRMQLFERFALGQCRLVRGNPEALDHVLHAAYALPVTPERLKELVRMKRHLEAERNTPKYIRRNVKYGYGGLADIEWFCHLYEIRYPTATHAGHPRSTDERIRAIARANLINALEMESMLDARRHLSHTRNWMWFLGYREDIVPENPDKLDRLAAAMRFSDGNEFLRYHESAVESVRGIYTEGLERLRIEV